MHDLQIQLQGLKLQKGKYQLLLKKHEVNHYSLCLEYARQEVHELTNEIFLLEQAIIDERCFKINNIIK